MDYIIREMRSEEYCLLSGFLYEAIYIPEGIEPTETSALSGRREYRNSGRNTG